MYQRTRLPLDGLTGPDHLSERAVEALAHATGVDVDDLDVCLYDHVDPSVLDTLFAPTATGDRRGSVSFVVEDVRVTCTVAPEGGSVRVDPADADGSSASGTVRPVPSDAD